MTERYVGVTVQVPTLDQKVYTYRLPSDFPFDLPYGSRVRVPFGSRKVDGFILGGSQLPSGLLESDIKPIESVYDLRFVPSSKDLFMAKTLSWHYGMPISAFLSLLWPPFIKRYKISPLAKDMEEDFRNARDLSGDRALGPSRLQTGDLILTKEEMAPSENTGKNKVSLIVESHEKRWGYYAERAKGALSDGKGVLILVPEIKRIPRILEYLTCSGSSLMEELALLHSALTGATRREAWENLFFGKKRLGLGTRSAVFAPVRNLSLIIVDEEESASYKAEDYPRYNGRDVAILRGPEVILGSSHPSLWTYQKVLSEKISLVQKDDSKLETIPLRVKSLTKSMSKLSVEVIDLLKHRSFGTLTPRMISSLEDAFSRGEKAILFLPRRGDASFVLCQDCGNVLKCQRCSLPLSYHAQEKALVCHTCGKREPPPDICPVCGSYRWKFSGPGVERTQAEFVKKFPSIPCYRFDQDVLKKATSQEIIGKFDQEGPSCLLTTQAILGYGPMRGVTLIGVISPDVLFTLPDYRASENAFLTLMSLLDLMWDRGDGSSAKDSDDRRVFLVQTRNPKNPAILGLSSPNDFYDVELGERAALNYPPCGHFARIECFGTKEDKVRSYLLGFAKECEDIIEKKDLGVDVLGPSPERKPKVRGKYRWNLALKGQDLNSIISVYREAIGKKRPLGVTVILDLEDPVF